MIYTYTGFGVEFYYEHIIIRWYAKRVYQRAAVSKTVFLWNHVWVVIISKTCTQSTFTCSKLTMKTPERCLALLLALNIFTPCSSVSMVNYEHVNADWVGINFDYKLNFQKHTEDKRTTQNRCIKWIDEMANRWNNK